jgi:hypothetical protein
MCSKRPASELGRRDARSGRSGAPRSAPVPPVRLFTVLAPVRQRARGLVPLASARPAELPKLGGGPLVVMNQIVHVELIDLTGVELSEPGAHVFEKSSQLALVIVGGQLPRGTTIGLVPGTTLRVSGPDHGRKLQRRHPRDGDRLDAASVQPGIT